MASIHLLGGKKKLLTIQVTDLVHLQSLVQWARLLKKHARSTIAVLTSVGLLVFLFTQYHDILNRDSGTAPKDAGTMRTRIYSTFLNCSCIPPSRPGGTCILLLALVSCDNNCAHTACDSMHTDMYIIPLISVRVHTCTCINMLVPTV